MRVSLGAVLRILVLSLFCAPGLQCSVTLLIAQFGNTWGYTYQSGQSSFTLTTPSIDASEPSDGSSWHLSGVNLVKTPERITYSDMTLTCTSVTGCGFFYLQLLDNGVNSVASPSGTVHATGTVTSPTSPVKPVEFSSQFMVNNEGLNLYAVFLTAHPSGAFDLTESELATAPGLANVITWIVGIRGLAYEESFVLDTLTADLGVATPEPGTLALAVLAAVCAALGSRISAFRRRHPARG